jgi:integrase
MPRKPKGRANGEGSVYREGKGWIAQITLANGKPKRRRAKTEAAALDKLDELRALRRRGVNLSKQSPTVAEWWSTWLDMYARQLKPNIREDYRGIGRRYVDSDAIGRRKVALLTGAEVQDWVDRLCDKVAPSTVRNAHARMHKCMKVAIQRRVRTDNPADNIDLPEARPAPIQPLDFDQSMRLLEILEDDRWAALYRLLINLGLREGEALGLTWDAIDLKRGTIRVYRQLKRIPKQDGSGKEFVLQTTKKAASDRILDLDEDIIAALRTHKTNQLEEELASRKRWIDTWGLVFVSENGAPIHPSNLLAHLHKTLEQAELPKIRVHDLRHTCATLMLDAGVSLVTVSKILGHSSVAITAKIYAHALDKSKASAIATLSERLRRAQ